MNIIKVGIKQNTEKVGFEVSTEKETYTRSQDTKTWALGEKADEQKQTIPKLNLNQDVGGELYSDGPRYPISY